MDHLLSFRKLRGAAHRFELSRRLDSRQRPEIRNRSLQPVRGPLQGFRVAAIGRLPNIFQRSRIIVDEQLEKGGLTTLSHLALVKTSKGPLVDRAVE